MANRVRYVKKGFGMHHCDVESDKLTEYCGIRKSQIYIGGQVKPVEKALYKNPHAEARPS